MTEVDLLIIGGGINGVAIAADAAGRDLNVLLCEKNDLASGTSSASTKLIHGGLRYLEYAKFSLVREALQERAILLKRAPHLVHPLSFLMPCGVHTRAKWQLYLGLKLYDFLAQVDKNFASRYLSLIPGILESEYQHAFSYMDCQTDDARLVIANALLARAKGATLLTYTECINAERVQDYWQVRLRAKDQEFSVKAKLIVNVAGPWVGSVATQILHADVPIPYRLIKGSHIVVPKLYAEKQAYTLQNLDGRVIFVIPYQQDYTLIGTTDIVFNADPATVKISEDEINYLCDAVNSYFKVKISKADLVWAYAGVRTLYDDQHKNPASITREHRIEVDEARALITVVGGKLTTHRALAAQVLDKCHRFFPQQGAEWTQTAILPGGDLAMSSSDFVAALQQQYPYLSASMLQRYVLSYGSISKQILAKVNSVADLGFDFGADLYQCEVDYLLKNEWAKTTEDIVWRRSKLGLKQALLNLNALSNYLQEVNHA